MTSIVDRLVKEVEQEEISDEEDGLPIEFYELRELAKNRVLLKDSFQIHLFLYLVINGFLFVLNLLYFPTQITSGYDLWSLWPILTWGIWIWTHGWAVLTVNIDDFQQRMFVVISSTIFFLVSYFIFVNYYSNYLLDITVIWWPYILVFLAIFLSIYAYLVFLGKDSNRFEYKVLKEVNIIIKEYENDINFIEKEKQEQNLKNEKKEKQTSKKKQKTNDKQKIDKKEKTEKKEKTDIKLNKEKKQKIKSQNDKVVKKDSEKPKDSKSKHDNKKQNSTKSEKKEKKSSHEQKNSGKKDFDKKNPINSEEKPSEDKNKNVGNKTTEENPEIKPNK
jgi:2TM domain